MPKPKQHEKARETLEIFAPLAHRLGIHAIKWELEDLAFATLHPRKYKEIKQLVSQQREERDAYVDRAGAYLGKELKAVGIEADISGHAKHFYSIYSKMTKKGREFNEIYDLTAMRVIVELGEGLLRRDWRHPLAVEAAARALQGHGRDAQVQHDRALHTTVIGPEGRPLEIQIRTKEMHRTASTASPRTGSTRTGRLREAAVEEGGARVEDKVKWLHLLDWQKELADPQEFVEGLKVDLFEDEVFVFTPKGEVKSLAAGATRSTSPTRSTPTWATAASARRSTARSCRSTTSCSRATSARC